MHGRATSWGPKNKLFLWYYSTNLVGMYRVGDGSNLATLEIKSYIPAIGFSKRRIVLDQARKDDFLFVI
jgi:hypothetical protein